MERDILPKRLPSAAASAKSLCGAERAARVAVRSGARPPVSWSLGVYQRLTGFRARCRSAGYALGDHPARSSDTHRLPECPLMNASPCSAILVAYSCARCGATLVQLKRDRDPLGASCGDERLYCCPRCHAAQIGGQLARSTVERGSSKPPPSRSRPPAPAVTARQRQVLEALVAAQRSVNSPRRPSGA